MKTTTVFSSGAPGHFSPGQFHQPQERLLWKILVVAILLYLVWGDRVSIQFAAPNEHFGLAGVPGQVQVSRLEPQSRNWSVLIAPENQSGEALAQVKNQCKSLIKKISPVAIAEMRQFRIPASILLAQAVMESNAGASRYTLLANNLYPKPCSLKEDAAAESLELEDGSHIHVYAKPWESMRAQCHFLKGQPRFEHLFQLDASDYRGWAQGLEQAGYAAESGYAESLIALIEKLNLAYFDQKGKASRS